MFGSCSHPISSDRVNAMLNKPPRRQHQTRTLHHHHHHPPILSATMSGSIPHPAQEAPAALLSVQPLQPPPSPQTHRALRRLQSAHALGARAAQQASLLSQQRRERPLSPSRNAADSTDSTLIANTSVIANANLNPNAAVNSTVRTRGRANSDATLPPPPYNPPAAVNTRRSGVKKPNFSHGHLSLQQIIREGPNDGDFNGALESARWKVIDEGVKAAEDGMVRHLPQIYRERERSWLTLKCCDWNSLP